MSTSRKSQRPPRHIMRLPAVKSTSGYGRASIYQFMKDGTFPKCRRIGPRAVGWDSDEVFDWVDARLSGGASA